MDPSHFLPQGAIHRRATPFPYSGYADQAVSPLVKWLDEGGPVSFL